MSNIDFLNFTTAQLVKNGFYSTTTMEDLFPTGNENGIRDIFEKCLYILYTIAMNVLSVAGEYIIRFLRYLSVETNTQGLYKPTRMINLHDDKTCISR